VQGPAGEKGGRGDSDLPFYDEKDGERVSKLSNTLRFMSATLRYVCNPALYFLQRITLAYYYV